MNPLYNPNNLNPMVNIIQQARELKKNFKGSPRDEVQRLLYSGQMSQQEFNRLSQVAQQVVQAMEKNI